MDREDHLILHVPVDLSIDIGDMMKSAEKKSRSTHQYGLMHDKTKDIRT